MTFSPQNQLLPQKTMTKALQVTYSNPLIKSIQECLKAWLSQCQTKNQQDRLKSTLIWMLTFKEVWGLDWLKSTSFKKMISMSCFNLFATRCNRRSIMRSRQKLIILWMKDRSWGISNRSWSMIRCLLMEISLERSLSFLIKMSSLSITKFMQRRSTMRKNTWREWIISPSRMAMPSKNKGKTSRSFKNLSKLKSIWKRSERKLNSRGKSRLSLRSIKS